MLIVRYLIALVFSIFMVATSLKIEERYRKCGSFKISTPDRLVILMEERQRDGGKCQSQHLEPRRLQI
ncbi:uncharacterized protein Dana_GF15638 [Drosophila ananassae]|uniref:Uncharacterized protein n=1 Tax=Drosophila ananassae TaxID=7217 RepID=B3MNE3_DROAN|nr:uncharacterized protein LOC6498444 [Drosophila ananassae]EDV32051.1 uncharacterized protein Dana_GF15638 [Drosophila ananassae]